MILIPDDDEYTLPPDEFAEAMEQLRERLND